MRRLSHLAILCVGLSLPWAGRAQAATETKSFDLYQASVNASDCKITFFLNGAPVEFLSGDGSNGMSASVPLSAGDLVKENKIKIVVEVNLICRPLVGDEPMLQVRRKGHRPTDFDPIRIGIAEVGGKIQVVRFMEGH